MRKLPCGSGFGRPFGTDSAPAGHGAGAESVPNTPSSANWREPIMCGAVVPMNQFPVTVL
jgi:hypothetical protein